MNLRTLCPTITKKNQEWEKVKQMLNTNFVCRNQHPLDQINIDVYSLCDKLILLTNHGIEILKNGKIIHTDTCTQFINLFSCEYVVYKNDTGFVYYTFDENIFIRNEYIPDLVYDHIKCTLTKKNNRYLSAINKFLLINNHCFYITKLEYDNNIKIINEIETNELLDSIYYAKNSNTFVAFSRNQDIVFYMYNNKLFAAQTVYPYDLTCSSIHFRGDILCIYYDNDSITVFSIEKDNVVIYKLKL